MTPVKDSGAASGIALQEAKKINQSLLYLAKVIDSVRNKNQHINYRDSQLTSLLMPSIERSAKIMMMVHLNPAKAQIVQTVSSAKFAQSTNETQIKK